MLGRGLRLADDGDAWERARIGGGVVSRIWIFSLLLLLVGCADACESENISACVRACNTHMLRWSKTEGCVCASPEGGAP